jgi:hypothetical protein
VLGHGWWKVVSCVCALATLPGCDALEQLIRSISDGASCTTDGDCLGGTCLSEFPEGYCTTLQCDTQGCSNIFGAECLVINELRTMPACYSACASDGDCRSQYRCVDLDGARVCLPGQLVEGLPQAGETGTSCARDTDCDGGTCLNNYTGGYCTLLHCVSDATCAPFGDGRCLGLDEQGSVTACFDGCQGDPECRFGYGCTDPDGGGGVCQVLDDRNPVRNPNGALDGQPCLVDINCRGGTCLRSQEGYPGGYCTTLHCTRVGCNGANTTCEGLENDTACFVTCLTNAECREGYECVPAGYCAPPINTRPPTDPTGTLDIVCQSQPIPGGRRFQFNVDATTESFAVVPLSETSQIRPTRLLLPNGSVAADFQGNHAFHDINWQLLINIAPTFFPAAPAFASITSQGGGLYALEVATNDPSPCFYVLEKSSAGSRIALNIYLVGVPGVTAATAPSNGNLQQMIDAFEAIYNNAGIALERVRYFDPSRATVDRFRLIRNFNEIFELLATSQNPGGTLGELLSVNVFLIQDFAIPQAPGLLGLSSGLPGVPGLHGTHGSGLVFTSSLLGFDNAALGQTMAHEVGHYNGLRHTTEHDNTHDPLTDTPECGNPNNGATCPDATNFMFPFSLGGVRQTVVSGQQAQVLRWAPLVR